MTSREDVICFEINNWFSGRDYPAEEPFLTWIREESFQNDQWCRENQLCVKYGLVDMSMSYCVAAPRSWVEENCPNLLSDKEYKYPLVYSEYKRCGLFRRKKRINIIREYPRKYSDFLCLPDENGNVYSRIDEWLFPEYCEENYGSKLTDEYWDKIAEEYKDDDNDKKNNQ